jgi:hypothetical protein
MPVNTEKILSRVERRYEAGKNHFNARSMLADLVLSLTTKTGREYEASRDDINQRIIGLLAAKGAVAEVYDVIQMAGADGYQTTSDTVRIIARDGVPTDAVRTQSRDGYRVRATNETSDTPEA